LYAPIGWRKEATMYSTPQIYNIGSASALIQGAVGSDGEPGISGHTFQKMQTTLEAE
jgi:hypothetical protein